MLVSLAWQSLASRRKSVLLTFLSLVISISVLLSVEHVRLQAKESFNRTVSDVDLIVGAPSGQLNLLLYTVFRMGSPTNNIQFQSYETLRDNPQVEWAIPISLGDSHRGFRVMGTNNAYFEHFKYGNKQALSFSAGGPLVGELDAIIGADVARSLGYQLGDPVVISHGIGQTSFKNHDATPFTITGILAPTGTPVDKTVHVSLAGIEAMHHNHSAHDDEHDHAPQSITAVLLGLKSKFTTLSLQHQVNNFADDRLMAILPGFALAELWNMMGSVENLLRLISAMVLIASLFGLSTMLLASMQQRQREIAVLRVLGAGPGVIFGLILVEALIVVTLATITSVGLISASLLLLDDWLAAQYGLFLSANLFNVELVYAILIVLAASIVTAMLPAFEAYRNALHSSLSARN